MCFPYRVVPQQDLDRDVVVDHCLCVPEEQRGQVGEASALRSALFRGQCNYRLSIVDCRLSIYVKPKDLGDN